jgi:hypothetical protein
MSILRNDPKLRKAYMAYQNDGVLDVFIGWCVFLAGLLMFTEIFWLAGAYVALVAPLFISFKESITVPRLGRDELDEATGFRTPGLQTLLVAGIAVFALMGAVLLVLLLGSGAAEGLRGLIAAVAGSIAAVGVLGGMAAVGYLYNSPRWYVYVVVTITLSALAWATGLALPWVIMGVGSVIAFTGSFYLLRFLRSHPLLPLGQRPEW